MLGKKPFRCKKKRFKKKKKKGIVTIGFLPVIPCNLCVLPFKLTRKHATRTSHLQQHYLSLSLRSVCDNHWPNDALQPRDGRPSLWGWASRIIFHVQITRRPLCRISYNSSATPLKASRVRFSITSFILTYVCLHSIYGHGYPDVSA